MTNPESKNVLSDLVSEAELAALLGIKSPRTLQKWRQQRKGPEPIKVSRKIYYNRETIIRWLEKREGFSN